MTCEGFMCQLDMGMNEKTNNTTYKIKLLIIFKLYQGENPHAWQAAVSGI